MLGTVRNEVCDLKDAQNAKLRELYGKLAVAIEWLNEGILGYTKPPSKPWISKFWSAAVTGDLHTLRLEANRVLRLLEQYDE
jgi:hypothetical protein